METEIKEFLLRHLKVYYETTHPDLTLYEWWVTPRRIDGLSFG